MRIDLHVHIYPPPDHDCAVLAAIHDLKETLKMDQATLLDALNSVADQLAKATAEIVAEIAALGATSPALDAAVVKLQTAAQVLDDLNADAPPPEPPPAG